MASFIKKTVLFLLILSLIIGYINYRYINTNKYKSMNDTNKFDLVPEEIEIANLGTSHGQYAFIYKDLDISSFNFAMPAQRLYYDHKLLKKHINNFKEDSTLIIPISYISFYLGYDNENFEEFNKMYYKILGFSDIKNLKLEDYIKYSLLPILTAEENIKYAFTKEDIEFEYEEEYPDYTMEKEKMIEEGRDTAKRHLDFIKEGQENKDEFVQILEDIITLSLENNINPVITTTPFTKYYNDHFSEEFYNDFTNTIETLIEKYPNVHYLDYSHDERFIDSPELFFDSSHLNLTGGRMFTETIMKDIEKGLN